LFWGALLIFIVSISILLSLIIVSRGFGSREKVSEQIFQTDFFGPVIPVLINSEIEVVKMLDDIVKNPNVESEIYNYFEEKLDVFGSVNLNIRLDDLKDDFYQVRDNQYTETFYYIYNSTKFLKLDLVINFE